VHIKAQLRFAAPDQQVAIFFHSTDYKKALGFGGLEDGLIEIEAVDQDIDFSFEIFGELESFENVDSQSRQFLKRAFQCPGGFTIQVQAEGKGDCNASVVERRGDKLMPCDKTLGGGIKDLEDGLNVFAPLGFLGIINNKEEGLTGTIQPVELLHGCMLQDLLLIPGRLDQKVIAFRPAGAEGNHRTQPIDGFGITGHGHEGGENLKVLKGARVEVKAERIKKTIKHFGNPDDSFHGNLRWGRSPIVLFSMKQIGRLPFLLSFFILKTGHLE